MCSLPLASSTPPTAAGRSLRDPSGIMSSIESILMSSCLGGVSIKCPLTVEYCLGISLPGSPLFHSFLLNAGASSNVASLGVIPGGRLLSRE